MGSESTKLAKIYPRVSITLTANSWCNKVRMSFAGLDVLQPQYSIGHDTFLQQPNTNKRVKLNYIDKVHPNTRDIK